jgi:quinolinate synthase
LTTEIVEKIQRLKERRKAIILAHNYQPGEIQDLADFVGDSLGLSRQAATTEAEVIVFCGVHFMAETAAILSPEKTVLLPEKNAGCPMADMITPQQLAGLKSTHPEALVVCYVNTPAEVKALSDYCCTSGNAVELVNSIPPQREIIFVPDKYLGQFIIDRTSRDMILWPGYCLTHVLITAEDIQNAKAKYTDAVVLAHPECSDQVRKYADELLSTSQMLNFAEKSQAKRFIIGTEVGIIHALKKRRSDAEFIAASERAICPNMKKITLAKVIGALEDMQYRVTVPDEIRIKALKAIDRMMEVLPTK